MARVGGAPICVITLTYTAGLDAVDAQMAAHVAWLEKGIEEGLFLAAGRQVPRVGGIILCRGHRAEVEAVAATDPFVREGVAEAAVTEFATSFAAPEIAALLQ